MQLNIRAVQANDNPVLASTIRTVFEAYGVDQPGTVYTDPTTDRLFELFQTNKAQLWVAVLNDEIVGCCGIYPTQGLPDGYAEIVKFYLKSAARGQGIGKALYQKCETTAKAFGYKALYIESLPEFKQAIHLYERLGFSLLKARLGNSGHFNCNIWLDKRIA